MKNQMYSKVNFGKMNQIAGKLVLNAVDYDFELQIMKMDTDAQTNKTSFNEIAVTVPLSKEEIYEISKGVFEPFIQAYNRIKFKVKEIVTDTVYSEIKFITKSLYALRLVGAYKINPQTSRKERSSILYVYKLSSWDEVKSFNNNTTEFEGTQVGQFEFDKFSVSRGSYVYKDIVAIDELTEVIKDANFKRSTSYTKFLEEVGKASQQTNTPNSNATYKPKQIPQTDSESTMSDEEYPWD